MAARRSSSSTRLVLERKVILPSSGKGVVIVSLNRPEKKNCFNTELCYELAAIFARLSQKRIVDDDNVAAVILTGEGTSFCAGADLANPPNPLEQSSDLPHDLEKNPVYQMSQLKIPLIGALKGYVVTGGFELALACDILVGDETVVFRDTHCKFALAPCWGLSQKLQRRVGPGRAKLLSLGAIPIRAKQALAWGLLDDLHAPTTSIGGVSSVLNRALEIADSIGKNDSNMVQRYKRAIDEGGSMTLARGLERERGLGIAHYLEILNDGATMQNAREFITDESRPRSKL